MLFLTRWFGVTGSDAERSLAREESDIEEITEKSLLMQANAARNNTGRSAAEPTQRVSAPEPNSKSLTLRSTATPRWRRGSRGEFSPSLAFIPRWCGLRMRTRR